MKDTAKYLRGPLPSTPRNGVYSLVDQAVVSGTRFLITILIARACGNVALGVYSLTLSLVLMAIMLQQTLITTPYSNFRNRMSAAEAPAYYRDVWMLSLVFAIGVCLVGGLAGLLFYTLSTGQLILQVPARDIAMTCWSAAAAAPFMIAAEFFRRTWLIRMEAARAFALDVTISLGVIIVLTALYFHQSLNESSVFLTLGLVHFAASVVAYRMLVPKGVVSKKRSLRERVKMHWKFGKWIFSAEALTFGKSHLLKWVIGASLGLGATGIYSACDSLVRAINPFFLGVASFTEPALAAGYARSGRKEVKRIAFWVLGIMILGTGPICLCVALFSQPLLHNLYGPDFAVYGSVVVWLVLAAFVTSNGYPLANSIQAIDRPEINFRIRLVTFCFVVLSSVLVAPLWGLWAVACVQFVGALISFGIRACVFQRLFLMPGRVDRDSTPELIA